MSFQQPYEQQSRRRRNAIFQPNYTIENPLSQIDRRGRGNTAPSSQRPNFSFIKKQLDRKNKNRPRSSNDVPNERLSDIEEKASYENYEDYGEGGSADDNLPIIPNIPLGTGGGQQPRRQRNSTIENPVSQIDRRGRGNTTLMFSAVDQTLLNQPFIREPLKQGRIAVEVDVNNYEYDADQGEATDEMIFRRLRRESGQTSIPLVEPMPPAQRAMHSSHFDEDGPIMLFSPRARRSHRTRRGYNPTLASEEEVFEYGEPLIIDLF